MPWCPQCGAEYREGFTNCSTCRVEPQADKPSALDAPAPLVTESVPDEAEESASIWATEVNPRAALLWILLIPALLAGWILGTHHIVRSAEGTRLVRKVHFTFAESFVSLDAITGMPAVAAQAKYPLAVKALQREGILESDEAREERIQREVQEQMDRSWVEVQRLTSEQ